MKYCLMIIVTMLLMIIIMKLNYQTNQLSRVGHHIEQINQIDNLLER